MLNATNSFAAGCVLASLITTLVFLTSPEPRNWRQCAPAQAGEQLVSTVQYEEKTECFYQKSGKIRRQTAPRQETRV